MIQCSKCGHKHSMKYAMQEKSCCLKCGDIINLEAESKRLIDELWDSICSFLQKNSISVLDYKIDMNGIGSPNESAYVMPIMFSICNFIYFKIVILFFIGLCEYLLIELGSIRMFLFLFVFILSIFIILSHCFAYSFSYDLFDKKRTTSLQRGSHAVDIIESMFMTTKITNLLNKDWLSSIKDSVICCCNAGERMKRSSFYYIHTLFFAGNLFLVVNWLWIVMLTSFIFIFIANDSVVHNESIQLLFENLNNFLILSSKHSDFMLAMKDFFTSDSNHTNIALTIISVMPLIATAILSISYFVLIFSLRKFSKFKNEITILYCIQLKLKRITE